MIKKLFIVLLFLTYFSTLSYSAPVDLTTAKNVAINWYQYWNCIKSRAVIEIDKSIVKEFNGHESCYIFTYKNGGFIIVSADNSAIPVLGYSFVSKIKEEITHPAVKDWLNSYSSQIDHVKKQRTVNREAAKLWDDLLNNDFSRYSKKRTIKSYVEPLLSTTWNQNQYYNESCPVDSGGSGGHAYAGCVATAMAQIMKFHNHPENGLGSYSYNHTTYGDLSANFNETTYDWTSMPDSISSSNSDVANFIYHAGISVEMDYGPSGSSASTQHAANSLIIHFNYDSSIEYVKKDQYTDTDWKNMLKTELSDDRPLLYSGSGSGAHAFVCDGYDSSDNFHFNWGWGGNYDGYFALTALIPDDDNYTNDQNAVKGIQPNNSSTLYLLSTGFEGISPYAYIPLGWNRDADNNATNWSFYSNSHSGHKSLGANSPDEWLITPELTLPSDAEISFSFYATRMNSYNQGFEVKLSTNGTDTSDFTIDLGTETLSAIWEEFSYTLSAYAGQTIYLGIKSTGTSDSYYYLFTDDYSVNADIPGPAIQSARILNTLSLSSATLTLDAICNSCTLSSVGFCVSDSSNTPTYPGDDCAITAAATPGDYTLTMNMAFSEPKCYTFRAFAISTNLSETYSSTGNFCMQSIPSLVTLSSFTAIYYPKHTLLKWKTSSEIENLGFYICRSNTKGGDYIRINNAVILAVGGILGAEYSYEDYDIIKGQTYYYKLEEVDNNNINTFHEPEIIDKKSIWNSLDVNQDNAFNIGDVIYLLQYLIR
ncbi:exported hypothetical protein [Candidatus Magnetomoraceae bacterium gMMP-15]